LLVEDVHFIEAAPNMSERYWGENLGEILNFENQIVNICLRGLSLAVDQVQVQ
jgi:hypothetical protein